MDTGRPGEVRDTGKARGGWGETRGHRRDLEIQGRLGTQGRLEDTGETWR